MGAIEDGTEKYKQKGMTAIEFCLTLWCFLFVPFPNWNLEDNLTLDKKKHS
jgi:hypothetical protein